MRITYSGENTIKMACSICSTPFEYPTEGRYCTDKLFRCNANCTETETPLDYERKQAASRMRREPTIPPMPMGPMPTGHDT